MAYELLLLCVLIGGTTYLESLNAKWMDDPEGEGTSHLVHRLMGEGGL